VNLRFSPLARVRCGYFLSASGVNKTVWEIDRRVIIAYLDRKRLSARAIHNNIVATLRPNIVGYSTVTRYLRGQIFFFEWGRSNADDRKPINEADEAILSALNESPFASVRHSGDSPTSLQ
jgi:hypothetical protein